MNQSLHGALSPVWGEPCLAILDSQIDETQEWWREQKVGGRGQYLSVMKLSVHIDLSLCDEARQVRDRVGDIYKEIRWPHCR